MSNEKESKRWNDDRWVAAWPKRERLTEALTPYLLEAAAAQPGQRVAAGDKLLVLDAMKIEMVISAPTGGVVRELLCQAGQMVNAGQQLAILHVA